MPWSEESAPNSLSDKTDKEKQGEQSEVRYLTPSITHRIFRVMNLPRGESWNRKLRMIIKYYVSDRPLKNNLTQYCLCWLRKNTVHPVQYDLIQCQVLQTIVLNNDNAQCCA